jgi:RNA polymerase sigma-70 factor (ECF subfamily)
LPHPRPTEPPDLDLVAAVKAGDEAAFQTLVERYYASMVRIAALYVHDSALAEDVTQESWIGVLKGLASFEGRSSFKTWLFTILTNRAKTRAGREGRYISLEPGWETEDATGEFEAVSPERFGADGDWNASMAPRRWETVPEDYTAARELRAVINQAVAALPPTQAEVIRLRDMEGWASDEVCNALAITETNQRVLLHRARSKVRAALERYFAEADHASDV